MDSSFEKIFPLNKNNIEDIREEPSSNIQSKDRLFDLEGDKTLTEFSIESASASPISPQR